MEDSNDKEGSANFLSKENGSISVVFKLNTSEFSKETQMFWEARYGRKISKFEAQSISQNMNSFFELLHLWEEKEMELGK